MDKPQEILDLEKELGFELTETKNENDILDHKKSKTYFLSEKREVIGLNLYGCKLSSISPLRDLVNLKKLKLEGNHISDISFLGNLVSLTELDLGGNQLSDISPLKQLVNLTNLKLWNNQVSDISPLSSLVKLTALDLWNNQISNISSLSGLVNLTYLNLGSNQLSDISPLSNLVNLTALDLTRNQLSDFSLHFLYHFPKLKSLQLFGNPIQNIPKVIFDKGVLKDAFKSVKDYLEGIEKAKQVKNNEVKVILIGNGSVGKTQVAKRLAAERGKFIFDYITEISEDIFKIKKSKKQYFEFNKNHDSTHAISLLKKNIECEFLEEGLNLTIWDFGGQDIYHATHRLFMKTRAVFLLVWDIENEVKGFHELENSEGEKIPFKNEELNYWLSYTSYFGKNSPILVVQNKIDKFDEIKEIAPTYDEIAQNELKKQFPITEFIQVSAENGEGFEILENYITEIFEDNEELKRELLLPLPAHWVAVRDRVRQEQQNPNGKKRISFQSFVEWCKEEDAENEADTLANFFHDTGVFYYQAKYFSGEIIINQSWAIEAVYKVLDKQSRSYKLLKQKKGILDYKIIKKVWSANSDEERELFIDYMLSTELCFENTDNKKRYTPLSERSFLIPQLLPSKSKEDILGYIESFELKPSKPKKYSFLPTSVIQRFMIKAKDFSSVELMWQTGLFVEYKESKVIVEAVYEKNNHHILIYHNSAAKNDLVEVILEELDKLDDENSSRNLDRNKLHLGEKSLQRGFEKLQKHKKESQPLIHTIMSEKITHLKKQAEAGKFQEVFDYLDLYFTDEPYHQYSVIKTNMQHQINMGFVPNPMQVQGLQLFLNSSKIKEIVPIIEQNHKTTPQKTTETMEQLILKQIKGLEETYSILIDKKTFFEKELRKTNDTSARFSLTENLKDIKKDMNNLLEEINTLSQQTTNSNSNSSSVAGDGNIVIQGSNNNQINIEINNLKEKTKQADQEIDASLKEEKKTSVFISYNHNEQALANQVRDFLRKEDIDVTIDHEAMKAGENIKLFIEKCIRENDVTLSLVSENSLLSSWVLMETVLTFAGEKIADKKFIAVYENDFFLKRSFVKEGMKKVRKELKEINDEIDDCRRENIGIEHLQDELTRYRKLENNLPEIVARLRNSLCIDISRGNFEEGMQKISNDIK